MQRINERKIQTSSPRLRIRKHPTLNYNVLEVNGVIVDWSPRESAIQSLVDRAKELGYAEGSILIVKESTI